MKKMIKKIITATLSAAFMSSACACSPQTVPPKFVDMEKYGIDYVIEIPEGQDITILQVTDTQAMLYEGIRTEFLDDYGRPYESLNRFNQVDGAFFTSGVTDTYIRTWQYVKEGVEKTNPDIIVLTGDNIYGETDDSGELWLEMIEVLDSFEIPWLCVFGNHDNESNKGLNWQIEAVSSSKYGYMRKGSTENGNCNYTVGIKQGNEIKYVFYMLDTNGCRLKPHNFGESLLPYNPDLDEIQQSDGIFPDQMEWMRDCSKKISALGDNIPSMIFMHIPPVESYYSLLGKYDETYGTWPFYTDKDGDIGMAREAIGGFDSGGEFFKAAKDVNCVGMFVGHQHKVATSTVYEGIRITYGLKTGTGDYHSTDMLGTTKITIKEADNSFTVEHIHTEIEYPLN